MEMVRFATIRRSVVVFFSTLAPLDTSGRGNSSGSSTLADLLERSGDCHMQRLVPTVACAQRSSCDLCTPARLPGHCGLSNDVGYAVLSLLIYGTCREHTPSIML
ncbi:hypothetical protein GY45DRAFT_4058 [Cubamyces sp. BRFM 1775]|nr:hypothetical protein GY45DRAFT_4058 [Cubamyces sp. BRFM 1775]